MSFPLNIAVCLPSYHLIPYRLTLRNFLSYREAALDFRGLHTACICGSNGAGKSSLLEAITWCLWGQSRADVEDDVIHLGSDTVRVDFIFQSQGQLYRVIRARHRGQPTALEFQIAHLSQPDTGQEASDTSQSLDLDTLPFRSLTEKGLRATQQRIIATLKLDYDTFVNSAYLRQGRADEFMLKRPSERKQILADLLKLNQYDDLADKAKDRTRDLKAQTSVLEQTLTTLEQQLQQRPNLAQERTELEATLTALNVEQDHDRAQLTQLQNQQQQRQNLQQQLHFLQQQRDRLEPDHQRLQQAIDLAHTQQQTLTALLQTAPDILAGYQHWQTLQQQEEQLTHIAQQHQTTLDRRRHLQQQLDQQTSQLQNKLEQISAKLDTLSQQEDDLQPLLSRTEDINAAVQKLQTARSQLQALDERQAQATPLLQRRQDLQGYLQQTRTRLSAKLEDLHTKRQHLQTQHDRLPKLQEELNLVNQQVQYLEARKRYQRQVRDRGLERRSFFDRLEARQQDTQSQLQTSEHKTQQLNPGAPCPLCNRPLDGDHWTTVQHLHQQERQDLLDTLRVLQDQLAVSDQEIQILRHEYRTIERELIGYPAFIERRGQLQQLLSNSLEAQGQLQQLTSEIIALEDQLQRNTYEPEWQQEFRQLDQTLQTLAYDDRNHALARGEVERWRWAEIKQAEIKQAQYRQAQIQQQRPLLDLERQALQTELATLPSSDLQQQITDLDRQLSQLAYNTEAHQDLRQQVRQGQDWQLRHQELQQAQQQAPQLEQHLTTLQQQLAALSAEQTNLETQQQQLSDRLSHTPDPSSAIAQLSSQIDNRRQQLDQFLAQLGRLDQQEQHLATLQQQYTQQQQQLQTYRHQQRLHQELAQAFGKNGIQALMIENLLPQLERETNHILSRLSNNQLHVQFITQKTRRSGGDKLIDTLDIRIADAKGTRPYETYSGGEAFRVNFSIRLALARLLAQRSGTALQLLIVDEGFGTQDSEGCNRLIAAINAIAPDFSCILTITHMPQFKEAFQARIEVSKTATGSSLQLAL